MVNMNFSLSEDGQHENSSSTGLIEYPYREIWLWKTRFWILLFVVPSAIAVTLNYFMGRLIFDQLSPDVQLKVVAIHFGVVFLYLCLLWVPHFLTFINWSLKVESTIIFIHNFFLLYFIWFIFPHEILKRILFQKKELIEKFGGNYDFGWYILIGLLLSGAMIHFFTSAASELSMAELPRQRTRKRKAVWLEGLFVVFVLVGFLVIEIWIFALQKSNLNLERPYEVFIEQIDRGQSNQSNQKIDIGAVSPEKPFGGYKTFPEAGAHFTAHVSVTAMSEQVSRQTTEHLPVIWLQLSALFAAALFIALFLFLSTGLANRMMLPILLGVTFHEMDLKGITFRAPTYFRHLWGAILSKFHFLTLGGGIFVFGVLITIVLLFWVSNYDIMQKVYQPDGLVLMAGIFVAWFGQFLFSLLSIEETYSDYFNKYIADHIMKLQGHMVFVGFGNLGKRVINRELSIKQHQFQSLRRSQKIVSPFLEYPAQETIY
ncbi:MAG: hypothetical protein Q9P14_02340 [candidate division KSB1 bacterium]|nr:hypothetical protein [candidate division KSB1 bacterium]